MPVRMAGWAIVTFVSSLAVALVWAIKWPRDPQLLFPLLLSAGLYLPTLAWCIWTLSRHPKPCLVMVGPVTKDAIFSFISYTVAIFLFHIVATPFHHSLLMTIEFGESVPRIFGTATILLVLTIVVAPITEEYFFRCLLVQRMADVTTVVTAVALSGAIFAAVHFLSIIPAAYFALMMSLLISDS